MRLHYREVGTGEPLVLLHGGLVSANPLWDLFPFIYGAHLATLAAHFRVIAPDTRGSGRSRHSGTEDITLDLLADDVAELIADLGLHRPSDCGFSMGGLIAFLLAIRYPTSVRAVVD